MYYYCILTINNKVTFPSGQEYKGKHMPIMLWQKTQHGTKAGIMMWWVDRYPYDDISG